MTERFEFHKTRELFLDANRNLSWETTYSGDNGSKMVLRSVAQGPETIIVIGGELE